MSKSNRGGHRPGAGRKPKEGQPLIKRTFALEAEHWERFDAWTHAHCLTQAELLRRMIAGVENV